MKKRDKCQQKCQETPQHRFRGPGGERGDYTGYRKYPNAYRQAKPTPGAPESVQRVKTSVCELEVRRPASAAAEGPCHLLSAREGGANCKELEALLMNPYGHVTSMTWPGGVVHSSSTPSPLSILLKRIVILQGGTSHDSATYVWRSLHCLAKVFCATAFRRRRQTFLRLTSWTHA